MAPHPTLCLDRTTAVASSPNISDAICASRGGVNVYLDDFHVWLVDDDDRPRLHRWQNDPGVVRWWEGDDVSWPASFGTAAAGAGPRSTISPWRTAARAGGSSAPR